MTEPAPLSTRLREQTKALHVQAERTGIMAQLLRGRATLPEYAALLVSLREIYIALEDGLAAHATNVVVRPLLMPGFARATALDMDLRELTHVAPPHLLAHAWLRYLGDLNGGQIIGGIVRDALGLPMAATQFYEFPALADPRAAAGRWREALDCAPLDASAQMAIIDEACDGFHRHIRLFALLGSAVRSQDAADSSSAA